MIDTIKLSKRLTGNEIDQLSCLKDSTETVFKKTGEVRLSARVGGFFVNLYTDLLVVDGSLSQNYKKGFSSLQWNEVEPALEQLQNQIGIDLTNGKLSRLDIEGTAVVSYPAKTYFDFLGEASHYHRSPQGSSLYYSNEKSRKKVFYDKTAKIKKTTPVANSPKKNLIRFEVRYLKYLSSVAKKLGRKELKVIDLVIPEVQYMLLNQWLKEYSSIKKLIKQDFQPERITGVKTFREAMELAGIAHLGGDIAVLEMLTRERVNRFNLSSDALYRIKQHIENLDQNSSAIMESTVLTELNTAIAIQYLTNLLSINDSD